jgi:intermediate peptidase
MSNAAPRAVALVGNRSVQYDRLLRTILGRRVSLSTRQRFASSLNTIQSRVEKRHNAADSKHNTMAVRALSSNKMAPTLGSNNNEQKLGGQGPLGGSDTREADRPGLFSIPGLNKPNDFVVLAKRAMIRCDNIRRALSVPSSPPEIVGSNTISPEDSARQVLSNLDALSNEICNVIDAAELCRSVHSDQEWRSHAQGAFQLLSEYIADLNTDEEMYRALCEQVVTPMNASLDQFAEEEVRMATLLQAEFERDGIHLQPPQRKQVQTLQNALTELESAFSNNIITKRKIFEVSPAREVHSIIPPHILNSVIPQSGGNNQDASESDSATVSSDAQIANTLLKYSANSDVRRQVYMETNTSVPENLEVLEDMRRARHELSNVLGFSSYAERFLHDKMAKTPQAVHTFLDQMARHVKKGAQSEYQQLLEAKRKVEGNPNISELHPWDIPFLTGLLKSSSHGFDSSSLAPYFTIQNCIVGMQKLCKGLFNIELYEEEVLESPDEIWCPTVKKLSLRHPVEGAVGVIYLDLYPRPDKYVHAAHFTVRCGCAVNHESSSGETATTATRMAPGGKEVQLPIVALVANLSSPNEEGVSLLSHSEVETLFHEFGHALHSLLSRTQYQHLSGTRAAVDFVETPSHLMEYFVWDPRFLSTFGRHYVSDEPIPIDLVGKVAKSRHAFSNLETQTQVLYAQFDQALFGPPVSGAGGRLQSSTDIFEAMHAQHKVPYAKGTHWHSRFGHLVTYGAGYYGYLYDQVFAADLWQTCFVRGQGENPLNFAAGEQLRSKLLQHGGAKDPHVMLHSMLQRAPTVDAFFDRS